MKAPKEKGKNKVKLYEVDLNNSITFNGETISKAIIDLDHINYGVDKKTGKLNKKKRLNFTLNDIKNFIRKLDGEDISAKKYDGSWSLYVTRIDSPIKGKHEGKEFIMVFKINYRSSEVIHTVTLYPGW